ncbi:MAG: [FeFe] hydrogenase, group A [Chitinispirillales bacterium]|jgi:NADH-quinone oxidoreductase subunit G|nr:[FeFe] hydrogenase, group A [Chitinispirillales bacterium]
MGKTINLKINGLPVTVQEGTTILEAARKAAVKIPTLCWHPDLDAWAACGICVVKIEGSPKILRACVATVEEGMNVITHDAELVEVRRTVIELILSSHPKECLSCLRNMACELQTLAAEYGIREAVFSPRVHNQPEDTSTTSIVLHPEKCVLCGRCAKVCQNSQGVWALEFLGRGEKTRIAPSADVSLENSPCIKCGQCSAHCPVGAIYEKSEEHLVWDALHKDGLYPVVQIAPAIRVAIGEAFGLPSGTLTTGKLYAALRRLGFKAVFDTNFTADLTIMEEGSEFVEMFKNKKEKLPLITTCCPAWVDYLEKFYQDMIPHFSTAKSPQAMLGAVAKTYYADKAGVDPKTIFMVSIMPCTAKKFEISRSNEMFSSGHKDIDISLTTRELVRMIKSAGIDFNNLSDEEADSILGEYTGAGTIFGVTGGVMEAALRTAYHLLTNKELGDVNLTAVRGLDGVKEAVIDIDGTPVKVAVAHGMVNISRVLDKVKAALAAGEEPPYHFIEVMACHGGCVGGGGQPYGTDGEIAARTKGIYKDDEIAKKRCSHQNPQITKIYAEFLEKPLSKKAHDLLHTSYTPRSEYRW